jgi:gas vesicle protein
MTSRDRDQDDEDVEFVTEDGQGGWSAGTFLGGLVLGAAIGVAAGMLFAPASGSTTRRKLRRRVADLRERAEEEIEDLSREARDRIAKVRG